MLMAEHQVKLMWILLHTMRPKKQCLRTELQCVSIVTAQDWAVLAEGFRNRWVTYNMRFARLLPDLFRLHWDSQPFVSWRLHYTELELVYSYHWEARVNLCKETDSFFFFFFGGPGFAHMTINDFVLTSHGINCGSLHFHRASIHRVVHGIDTRG